MIVAMLPAYFRFSQCLRRYRDSKEAFPHLANAGESLSIMFTMPAVIVIGFSFSLRVCLNSEICIIILRDNLLVNHLRHDRKVFKVAGKSLLLLVDRFCDCLVVLRIRLGHFNGLGSAAEGWGE